VGKFQCRLCGLRFTAKQKHHYTYHLDWHYLENKQEKDLSTTTSSTLLPRNRNWFSSVQEWTVYEENIEEQIRTGKLISTFSRPIKENNLLIQGENILSSLGVISCPATGNGDGDDDVSFHYTDFILKKIVCIFSGVMYVMIHLKISLMIIEKNGI
jgi:hypothetical protein